VRPSPDLHLRTVTDPRCVGLFSHHTDEHQAYQNFQQSDNKAELSHEVISGAAAFEAMKAYENHCAQNGKPTSHAQAKEEFIYLSIALDYS
jgi:hypothetical protein